MDRYIYTYMDIYRSLASRVNVVVDSVVCENDGVCLTQYTNICIHPYINIYIPIYIPIYIYLFIDRQLIR